MKLLVITNNPTGPSFRQRIEIYQDLLSQNDIRCVIQKLPSGILNRRRLFHQAKGFDGVFLHRKRLNRLDAHFLQKNARKIIYDFDDALMFRDKTPNRPDHKRMRDFARTIRLADAVIAGNEYLAEQARPFNNHVHVIPTGLAVNDFQPDCTKPGDEKIRLVWIGSKSTLSYLEALREPLEAIGKKYPQAILRIIADDFFDLENLPVEKHRWSLETQARDVAECDIGLAPLPDDPFTRGKCGFKILQYAAAGLPTVASPVGVNTEIVQSEQAGYLAQSPKQWIEHITDLLNTKNKRDAIGKTAHTYIKKKYDIAVVSKQLIRLITKTLKE